MVASKFSKSEAIKFGLDITKKNLKFFIVVSLIFFIISFLPNFILTLTEPGSLNVVLMVLLFSLLFLSLIVELGFLKIALNFYDNEKSKISDIFLTYPLFLKYLGGLILYSLIVLLGLILLVIPGIIWSIKFQFFPCFIVDKKIGPLEALKRSSKITRGSKWNLFLFGLLVMLINLAGTLFFIVGLLFTIPVTMLAYIFVYRKLLSQTDFIEQTKNSNYNKEVVYYEIFLYF